MINRSNKMKITKSQLREMIREVLSEGEFAFKQALKKAPKVGEYYVLSNQYGRPAKTYYYIVDNDAKIFHHKDKKWRKKELSQMWTYAFGTEKSAVDYIKKNL